MLLLRIAGADHEVAAVTRGARVQDRVAGVQVDVGALLHHPVLVVAQKQVLAPLVEEPALDTLAAFTFQQDCMSVRPPGESSPQSVARFLPGKGSAYGVLEVTQRIERNLLGARERDPDRCRDSARAAAVDPGPPPADARSSSDQGAVFRRCSPAWSRAVGNREVAGSVIAMPPIRRREPWLGLDCHAPWLASPAYHPAACVTAAMPAARSTCRPESSQRRSSVMRRP